MNKLLFQFDTDSHPSVFDTVVGYDGGADHVIGHGGLTPENITSLVEGTIFTRGAELDGRGLGAELEEGGEGGCTAKL